MSMSKTFIGGSGSNSRLYGAAYEC